MSETWSNWAGNQTASAVQRVHPRGPAEIAEVLAAAARDGQHVRPVGSGHSFTAIAKPDSEHGRAVQLDRPLGRRRLVDAPADGSPSRPACRCTGSTRCSRPRAGHDEPRRHRPADHRRRALDRDARHRREVRRPRHADRAASSWCSPTAPSLTAPPSENPEVFAAARVGLGALGVVTAVTLQCEPAFVLRAEERPDAARRGARRLRRARRPGTDHFEFYWFPHTERDAGSSATTGCRADGLAPAAPVARVVGRRVPLQHRLRRRWSRSAERVPAIVPPLDQRRRPGAVLAAPSPTSRTGCSPHRAGCASVEMEYAVPREPPRPRCSASSRPGRARTADRVPRRGAGRRRRRHHAVHRVRARHAATSPCTCPPVPTTARTSGSSSRSSRRSAGDRTGASCTASTPTTLRQRYPRFDEFIALRDRLDPSGAAAQRRTSIASLGRPGGSE